MPKLEALRDLAHRRSALGMHLEAVGPERFAEGLEALLLRASTGHHDGREACVALASWAAHGIASDGRSPLAAVGEAAARAGLPLGTALFVESPPRAALARRGRLAEASIGRFSSLSFVSLRRDPEMPVDEWYRHMAWLRSFHAHRWSGLGLTVLERFRMHHDPTFIGRLLDAPWLRSRDVVVIASRRPTTPALSLAVATRDKWLSHPRVQEALVKNPFTPTPIAASLLPAASESYLLECVAGDESGIRRGAEEILRARRGRLEPTESVSSALAEP